MHKRDAVPSSGSIPLCPFGISLEGRDDAHSQEWKGVRSGRERVFRLMGSDFSISSFRMSFPRLEAICKEGGMHKIMRDPSRPEGFLSLLHSTQGCLVILWCLTKGKNVPTTPCSPTQTNLHENNVLIFAIYVQKCTAICILTFFSTTIFYHPLTVGASPAQDSRSWAIAQTGPYV